MGKKKADACAKDYDLWAEANRTNQSTKPNYVPSLLPSVKVADAGASYNPDAKEYEKYALEIAKEEEAIAKREAWATNKMKLRPGDRYATKDEMEREEAMGFLDDEDESSTADEIKSEPDADAAPITKRKPKPKTQKQRRKQMELRLQELNRMKSKRTKRQEAEYNRLKSILKEVNGALREQATGAAEKRRQRILRRLIATKRLGRGKFEEYKEPVVLPDEISGSLRTIRPHGNALKERVSSMQKRNIVQPPSFVKQKQIKNSLKFKVTEKRKVREYVSAKYGGAL